MTGRPDWQEVPRGFNARELLNELVTLAAGATTTRALAAANLDDVVGVFVDVTAATDAIWLSVSAKNPLGDVIERQTGMAVVSEYCWLPVQNRGGDVEVRLCNLGGSALTNVPLRAWSYIGLTVDDLLPRMEVQHFDTGTVAAGARFVIEVPHCTLLPQISLVATFTQTFSIRARDRIPNLNNVPTTHVSTDRVIVNGAAGAVVAAVIDVASPNLRVDLLNTAGASGSGDISFIMRRPA